MPLFIAYFVSNFVAMATRVHLGKISLAAIDSPTPKTPYRCKDLEDISYRSRVIANFVSNFVARQPERVYSRSKFE